MAQIVRIHSSQESSCNVGDPGSIPGSGRSPGDVFLPGESHGQRSLAGYSPRGHKESDTTERLTLSLSFFQMGKKLKKKREYMYA